MKEIMKSEVEIVLATYNGDRYLEKQLESIVGLEEVKRILIHDDGSNDSTVQILSQWASRHPKICIIVAESQGSAKNNFSYLLEHTEAPYILCADQDDIWLPEKVTRLLREMKFYESVYGIETPLLVHSDLKLIDENGEEFAQSFWKYQNLDPAWGDRFNLLITQNIITGCAMMVNRALLKKSLPISKEAIMHDWWLALVACAFGKVIWVGEPTVLYRQHQTNAVGAKAFDISYLIKKSLSFADAKLRRSSQNACAMQALAFASRFPDASAAKVARKFAQLENSSSSFRRSIIRQEKFYKIGLIRNFAWLWLF